MNVICISDTFENVTKGKLYEVIDTQKFHYYIINDQGNEYWYSKYFFKTKREIRDEKFKQLGL